MNTVQYSYVLQDRRKSAVNRILKGARFAESDVARIREYCELSYKRGYYAGQQASAKKLREIVAATSKDVPQSSGSMSAWTHFSLTSADPIECMICGATVPADTLHEHTRDAQ